MDAHCCTCALVRPAPRLLHVFLVALLLGVVVVEHVTAYTYVKKANEYRGHCKDEEGHVHGVGESWTSRKRCELITCTALPSRPSPSSLSHGGLIHRLHEEVNGCIAFAAEKKKGCTWIRLDPRSAPYPDCCPFLKCA